MVTDARDGRADQVRLERLPRHQDHLHQRDGQPVRGGRRRRAGRGQGHGPGPPHRLASSCTPGPGYGGSCFPKDTNALVRIARSTACACRIVEAVIERQRAPRRRAWCRRSRRPSAASGRQDHRVLGLAFKPNTDDIRDAPALAVIAGAAAPRRHGPRPRPGRPWTRPGSCWPGGDVRRRRLRGRRRRRLRRPGDGVERVPHPRPEAAVRQLRAAAARRPAQRLQPRRPCRSSGSRTTASAGRRPRRRAPD